MSYNGWKNRETWNVALWIGNDEGLYKMAQGCKSYKEFVETVKELGDGPITFETPDHVAWNDSSLDLKALDEMIAEL